MFGAVHKRVCKCVYVPSQKIKEEVKQQEQKKEILVRYICTWAQIFFLSFMSKLESEDLQTYKHTHIYTHTHTHTHKHTYIYVCIYVYLSYIFVYIYIHIYIYIYMHAYNIIYICVSYIYIYIYIHTYIYVGWIYYMSVIQ